MQALGNLILCLVLALVENDRVVEEKGKLFLWNNLPGARKLVACFYTLYIKGKKVTGITEQSRFLQFGQIPGHLF